MNPLSCFDAIYVINLPTRTDRREEMAMQLASVGLAFDSPQVTLFPAVRPTDAGGFESIGARGCFSSHLEALRATRGRKSVLILEDDLDFVPGMRVPPLPDDWGIFYGGAKHSVDSTGRLTQAGSRDIIICAHFVAFNGAVIERVIAYLEAMLQRPTGDPAGGPMHVDGAYVHFRADNPDVITYLATPDLGYQRPSRTDIHRLRWFDRMPWVRDIAQFARRTIHSRLPKRRDH